MKNIKLDGKVFRGISKIVLPTEEGGQAIFSDGVARSAFEETFHLTGDQIMTENYWHSNNENYKKQYTPKTQNGILAVKWVHSGTIDSTNGLIGQLIAFTPERFAYIAQGYRKGMGKANTICAGNRTSGETSFVVDVPRVNGNGTMWGDYIRADATDMVVKELALSAEDAKFVISLFINQEV